MRISDWSSDVCSSDLEQRHHRRDRQDVGEQRRVPPAAADRCQRPAPQAQVALQLRNPRVGEVPADVRADVIAALLACGLARKPPRAPCNVALAQPAAASEALDHVPLWVADRKRGVEGKSGVVSVDLGGSSITKKKKES